MLAFASCQSSRDASRALDMSSAAVCVGPPGLGGTLAPSVALTDTEVPGAFDQALAYAALDREALGLAKERTALSRLVFDDPRMFEGARAVIRRPLDLRARGRMTGDVLDDALASATPVTDAILAASALREAPIDACVEPSWLLVPEGDAPLARVIAETTGTNDLPPELHAVPLELQRALVPVVRALSWATGQIDAARAAAGEGGPRLLPAISSVPGWLLGVRRFDLSRELVDSFERVDARRMSAAAATVSSVIEQMRLRRFAGLDIPSVSVPTKIGTVVLRGRSDDVWEGAEAPLLLIDTGGDDRYYGPLAASSLAHPLAVAVDLGGRDLYAYREVAVEADRGGDRLPSDGAGRAHDGRTLSSVGRHGSGTLGVGLLFDLGDEADVYRSLIASQGVGSHGVGVLFDEGGDDVYEAEGFSQGAAAWGIGLLLDRSGDDRYFVHNSGQGFGFTRGIGALVDLAGADVYTANPGEPSLGGSVLYASDQLPGPPTSSISGNHSFAQGCGAGHRPDWPDPGWPFPGGLGVLRDARGDDQYIAGVFAQGCGFVQGVGMLLDGAGDDSYDGLYYVEGAAAHLAAAVLLDDGGDDRFNARFPIEGPALGAGNDLSVALNINTAGNDTYRASWTSLGGGVANGIGLFIDDGGSDHFDVKSLCLGAAMTSDVRPERRSLPTIGIFVKADGAGSYTIGGNVADRYGQTWTSSAADSALEIGVGVDRSTEGAPR